jgi:hypothetical protein
MPAVLELRAVADRRDDGSGDIWSDALDLRNAPDGPLSINIRSIFSSNDPIPRSKSLKNVIESSPRPRAIVASSLAAPAKIFGMRRQAW